MFTHYSFITGCEDLGSYGDGYCDDFNNNEACFFDAGDCCGSNVNTAWCTVCQCLEGGGTTTPSGITTTGYCNPSWTADGRCDDMNNHLDCSYDGGDCCGSNVNTQYCNICQCHEGGGGDGGGNCKQDWIADGYCDDINNNFYCSYDGGDCCGGIIGWIADGYCDNINNNKHCSYDGGDCCGPNINTEYCTGYYECMCLE